MYCSSAQLLCSSFTSARPCPIIFPLLAPVFSLFALTHSFTVLPCCTSVCSATLAARTHPTTPQTEKLRTAVAAGVLFALHVDWLTLSFAAQERLPEHRFSLLRGAKRHRKGSVVAAAPAAAYVMTLTDGDLDAIDDEISAALGNLTALVGYSTPLCKYSSLPSMGTLAPPCVLYPPPF